MEKMIQTILEAMEETLDLKADEMKEMLDADLQKLHLIDSLSTVVLIARLEEKLGKEINLKQLTPTDFTSIKNLAHALVKID